MPEDSGSCVTDWFGHERWLDLVLTDISGPRWPGLLRVCRGDRGRLPGAARAPALNWLRVPAAALPGVFLPLRVLVCVLEPVLYGACAGEGPAVRGGLLVGCVSHLDRKASCRERV